MTAAAMVRGLGSKIQPSTLSKLGFGLVDAAWIAVLIVLVVGTSL